MATLTCSSISGGALCRARFPLFQFQVTLTLTDTCSLSLTTVWFENPEEAIKDSVSG